MERVDEPFMRGELVTLREYTTAEEPLGRILSVAPSGDHAEVAWQKLAGQEHVVTEEATVMLRRVHESEMDTAR